MSSPVFPESDAALPSSAFDDADLQELAEYAAEVLGAPVALITELGAERQTFLANVGFSRDWTALEESFCAQAVLHEGVFEVPDATQDPRFRDNPLVTGEPHVRFYAGVPVRTGEGTPRNALCALDTQPRKLTDFQRRTLALLGRQVEARLALRARERRLEEAEAASRATEAHYQRLFNSIDEGFAVLEMVYEDGRVVDYRFKEFNAAFEAQAGVPSEMARAGMTIREIAPDIEESWIETYGGVAVSGKPLRFEMGSEVLGRECEVYAFPLEGERSREVGVIFKDVQERLLAERALSEAIGRLDAVLAAAEIGVWDYDPITGHIGGDANLGAMFGLDPETARMAPAEAFIARIHPEDRPAVAEAFGRAAREGTPYEVEYRTVVGDRVRHLVARGFAQRGDDGRVVRMPGAVLDVTRTKAAQNREREAQETFRTVFEQAPDDAILVLDAQRRILAWNPAAERVCGWSAEEAVGQPADLIFTPEDRADGAVLDEMFGALLDGHAPDERWHLRKDGSRFWGSGTMNALHDPDGSVRGYLKVFRDATERHAETRALAFLRSLTDVLIDVREADEIVAVAERMLGEYLGVQRVAYGEVSEDGETALVTREWTNGLPSVVGEHRVASFGPALAENLKAGRSHVSRDAEADYAPGAGLEAVRRIGSRASLMASIAKEGRTTAFMVAHSAAPRDWTDEDVVLVRQVADRVTAELERARAEASLRDMNEALEARVEERTAELERSVREAEGFNYAISHDLRTPLRAISMTSSVLMEEAGHDLSFGHRELLERQRRAAARLAMLIDGLLQLSRLSRVDLKRQTIDMSHEADSVGRLEAGCRVEVQEGMTAEGDLGLVHSVWQNLVGNACKFSPNGGAVRVGQEGGAFYVRDEGVGFDMRYAPKIFLPFERLVADDEFPGTGIGLANVKRIVERHGGRVWVESEPGKGSTFWFTLA